MSNRNYIEYIARTRDYYRAQGFDSDYAWARNDDVPFTRLTKPLRECMVGIVTTAVAEPEVPKPIREAASYSIDRVPAAFDTSELSWDKGTTHMNDRESYFPLASLQRLADEGSIKGIAPRFYFVPTEYSQRNTTQKDAPATLSACQDDGVDIALLVPI